MSTMAGLQFEKNVPTIDLSPKCQNCNKVVVCSIYKGMSGLLEGNWDEGVRPFEADALAQMCKEFLALGSLNL